MLAVKLVGERVDGTGHLEHPMHAGTFDEAVAIRSRFDAAELTTAAVWQWSIVPD